MKFAIVGAGLAGAVIGSHLHEAGFHVRLFDKGRGPGGRLSTRRVPYRDCDIGFDHGCTRTPDRNGLICGSAKDECAGASSPGPFGGQLARPRYRDIQAGSKLAIAL